MLQILPKNIIPITEARGKLDDLVREAKGENFFVISQQGKTKAAVIDVEYLLELQKKVDMAEMRRAREAMQEGFHQYLIRKGYNPDKISDKQAEKILFNLK